MPSGAVKRSPRLSMALGALLLLNSCTSAPVMIQPQINSLAAGGKFSYALKVLQNNEKNYGENNELLYLLDYGLLLHSAGRYEESIPIFEEAKKKYDELFTVSLSKEAKTWLVNDYSAPYRGEDFERVLINVFQAMNFIAIGNYEEALVEARDADFRLKIINQQYKPDQQNVYKEDAFSRMMMGFVYEAAGGEENLNDAYISYYRALESYENNYQKTYGTPPPKTLIENTLSLAEYFNPSDFDILKAKYPGVDFPHFKEKKKKAEVVVVQYHGLSPIKHSFDLPIPLPNGIVTRLSFPRYDKRAYDSKSGLLKVVQGGKIWQSQSELGEDISAIAIKNLKDRQARVIAKAVVRSGGKVIVEQMASESLRSHGNETASNLFRYVASLYNIISEQADLRSWQTLPGEIRLARVMLDPGEYEVNFEGKELGKVSLGAGEKKFFIVRTNE